MAEQEKSKRSLGAELLREEIPDNSRYQEYRMNLEYALNRAERLENVTVHICWISFLLAFVLTFVGGSKIVGSFDPFDERANPLSITLGVIYSVASLTWPISLAIGFSRFRPRIRKVKQQITDAKIEELQREVKELREQLGE